MKPETISRIAKIRNEYRINNDSDNKMFKRGLSEKGFNSTTTDATGWWHFTD